MGELSFDKFNFKSGILPMEKIGIFNRTSVLELLNSSEERKDVTIFGWIRTRRKAKGFVFLEVNDGSCLKNIQVIAEENLKNFEEVKRLGLGSSVRIKGDLVKSIGYKQKWEIKAKEVEILGIADQNEYPLQKKRHSDEFLRTIAHLRPRTNKYGAINRIRSEVSFIIHEYFHKRGFFYVHTPIITALDCEGAGELFKVTSFELDEISKYAPEEDFFGKKAYLTVSGQLAAEIMACALGKVYTFGPTFRAENSNTPRHAAEFWMVEPEVAFADLEDIMDLAEDFLKTIIEEAMKRCKEDLELFANFIDKDLFSNLEKTLEKPFVRIPYKEAIEILKSAKKEFQYPVFWGADLQTEHERYLTEEHFKSPVIVYDFPIEIKPFYMRINPDGKTVAGMDVLFPKVGEVIGGSQREERYEMLVERIKSLGLKQQDYAWYLDLRKFGTVPHSGFGLGLERFLMYLTSFKNIRDVLPFPRTPKHLEF